MSLDKQYIQIAYAKCLFLNVGQNIDDLLFIKNSLLTNVTITDAYINTSDDSKNIADKLNISKINSFTSYFDIKNPESIDIVIDMSSLVIDIPYLMMLSSITKSKSVIIKYFSKEKIETIPINSYIEKNKEIILKNKGAINNTFISIQYIQALIKHILNIIRDITQIQKGENRDSSLELNIAAFKMEAEHIKFNEPNFDPSNLLNIMKDNFKIISNILDITYKNSKYSKLFDLLDLNRNPKEIIESLISDDIITLKTIIKKNINNSYSTILPFLKFTESEKLEEPKLEETDDFDSEIVKLEKQIAEFKSGQSIKKDGLMLDINNLNNKIKLIKELSQKINTIETTNEKDKKIEEFEKEIEGLKDNLEKQKEKQKELDAFKSTFLEEDKNKELNKLKTELDKLLGKEAADHPKEVETEFETELTKKNKELYDNIESTNTTIRDLETELADFKKKKEDQIIKQNGYKIKKNQYDEYKLAEKNISDHNPFSKPNYFTDSFKGMNEICSILQKDKAAKAVKKLMKTYNFVYENVTDKTVTDIIFNTPTIIADINLNFEQDNFNMLYFPDITTEPSKDASMHRLLDLIRYKLRLFGKDDVYKYLKEPNSALNSKPLQSLRAVYGFIQMITALAIKKNDFNDVANYNLRLKLLIMYLLNYNNSTFINYIKYLEEKSNLKSSDLTGGNGDDKPPKLPNPGSAINNSGQRPGEPLASVNPAASTVPTEPDGIIETPGPAETPESTVPTGPDGIIETPGPPGPPMTPVSINPDGSAKSDESADSTVPVVTIPELNKQPETNQILANEYTKIVKNYNDELVKQIEKELTETNKLDLEPEFYKINDLIFIEYFAEIEGTIKRDDNGKIDKYFTITNFKNQDIIYKIAYISCLAMYLMTKSIDNDDINFQKEIVQAIETNTLKDFVDKNINIPNPFIDIVAKIKNFMSKNSEKDLRDKEIQKFVKALSKIAINKPTPINDIYVFLGNKSDIFIDLIKTGNQKLTTIIVNFSKSVAEGTSTTFNEIFNNEQANSVEVQRSNSASPNLKSLQNLDNANKSTDNSFTVAERMDAFSNHPQKGGTMTIDAIYNYDHLFSQIFKNMHMYVNCFPPNPWSKWALFFNKTVGWTEHKIELNILENKDFLPLKNVYYNWEYYVIPQYFIIPTEETNLRTSLLNHLGKTDTKYYLEAAFIDIKAKILEIVKNKNPNILSLEDNEIKYLKALSGIKLENIKKEGESFIKTNLTVIQKNANDIITAVQELVTVASNNMKIIQDYKTVLSNPNDIKDAFYYAIFLSDNCELDAAISSLSFSKLKKIITIKELLIEINNKYKIIYDINVDKKLINAIKEEIIEPFQKDLESDNTIKDNIELYKLTQYSDLNFKLFLNDKIKQNIINIITNEAKLDKVEQYKDLFNKANKDNFKIIIDKFLAELKDYVLGKTQSGGGFLNKLTEKLTDKLTDKSTDKSTKISDAVLNKWFLGDKKTFKSINHIYKKYNTNLSQIDISPQPLIDSLEKIYANNPYLQEYYGNLSDFIKIISNNPYLVNSLIKTTTPLLNKIGAEIIPYNKSNIRLVNIKPIDKFILPPPPTPCTGPTCPYQQPAVPGPLAAPTYPVAPTVPTYPTTPTVPTAPMVPAPLAALTYPTMPAYATAPVPLAAPAYSAPTYQPYIAPVAPVAPVASTVINNPPGRMPGTTKLPAYLQKEIAFEKLQDFLQDFQTFATYLEKKQIYWKENVTSVIQKNKAEIENSKKDSNIKRANKRIYMYLSNILDVFNDRAKINYKHNKDFFLREGRRKLFELNRYISIHASNPSTPQYESIKKNYNNIMKTVIDLNTKYYDFLTQIFNKERFNDADIINLSKEDQVNIKIKKDTVEYDTLSPDKGYDKKIKSLYTLNYNIMEIIFDSQFFILYVIKGLRILFSYVSFFLASRVFSPMYEDAVYDGKKNPPPLWKFMFIFAGFDISFNAFLIVILYILKLLFKTDDNSFLIDNSLFTKYVADYLVVLSVIMLIGILMSRVITNKKFFKYKYEGIRAIRAFENMMFSASIVLNCFPFFLMV
jgi:hypothetical protein